MSLKGGRFTRAGIFAALMAAMMAGCSAHSHVLPPDQRSAFLEHAELMTPQPDRAPFQLLWVGDRKLLDTLKIKYTQIYIAPVSTDFLEQEPGSELPPDAIAKIASDFAKYFAEAVERDPKGHLDVTGSPDGNVFVLQIAVIKLVPTKAAINAVENIAGIFIPGSLPVIAASNVAGEIAAHQIAKGRVGMALKLYDGATGQLLAEAYDEREDRAALIVNTEDFTRWGNARMIIRNWAAEFTRLMDTPGSVKVRGPSPISIILW